MPAEFNDSQNKLVLDIKNAYDVAELEQLTRTFVYNRQQDGSLTITDRVLFSESRDFGMVLITFGKWKKVEPNKLLVKSGSQAVEVNIEVKGANFEISAEKINEVLRYRQRLGNMSRRNLDRVKDYRVQVLRERRIEFYRKVREKTEELMSLSSH